MANQIEIYKYGDSEVEVKVKFEKENVWLSQKQMAELFEKDTDTIGLHLKNIFSEEELVEEATTEFFSVVQIEGKRQVKINDNGLTAIALLVAQSKPEEKEIIIQLIVALIAESK